MNRIVRIILASLGLCGGCSKSGTLTPSQFTEECAKALHERSASLKVEIVRDLELRLTATNGYESRSFLYNAYDLYRLDPTAKATCVERVVAAALEMAAGIPNGVDRTRIVPIIKDKPWLEESRQAMLKSGAKEVPGQVYEDFNQDLVILYGEDSAKNIRYFRPEDLNVAKIEREELRPLACENLKRLLPKIECHGANGLYMVTAGGDYEASLLLLDSIWDGGQMEVSGDIVVAIPTRGVLLVTGSNDPNGITKVREIVQDAYSNGAYRLTPQLFVRRDGRFVKFEDGSGPRMPPVVGPMPR
jgi:uncharacterized protein YtpQ (UPF0354 family)